MGSHSSIMIQFLKVITIRLADYYEQEKSASKGKKSFVESRV